MRRRLVALVALAGGAFAGLAVLRRLTGARRERVDIYYEDGSLVSLNDGDAAPLLDLARAALRDARR